jgi:hypothetical protein
MLISLENVVAFYRYEWMFVLITKLKIAINYNLIIKYELWTIMVHVNFIVRHVYFLSISLLHVSTLIIALIISNKWIRPKLFMLKTLVGSTVFNIIKCLCDDDDDDLKYLNM